MSFKYEDYVIPGLAALCVFGAMAVVVSAQAPMDTSVEAADEASYEVRVPENMEPDNNIPTMEQVVEKHLFVPDRKATGQNTFPDLLVKGIYVGSESSAVFSLKYRPEANVRVWQGDVDSVISQVTDPRDPRKPIVDFLSEWDIKEITFKGVTVEHIITGEVETYLVDYTPAKHVKDNAEAGYGQGMLTQAAQGGLKTQTTKTQAATKVSAGQQQARSMIQLRDMVQQMTPEQRARLAQRIQGGGAQQKGDQQNAKKTTAKSNGSKNSASKSGSNKKGR